MGRTTPRRTDNCPLRRRHEGQRGSTLIELLVVIAVLAILAAIVIFNLTDVTNRGDTSAFETDLRSIQVASDAYYNDARGGTKSYPFTLTDLVPAYLYTTAHKTPMGPRAT